MEAGRRRCEHAVHRGAVGANQRGVEEWRQRGQLTERIVGEPAQEVDKKVLDDSSIEPSMTTERDEGALGSSKCKKASDAMVRAARRPGSIEVLSTSEVSGPSTLRAVSEPAPST